MSSIISAFTGGGNIGRATVQLVLDDQTYAASLARAKTETAAATTTMDKLGSTVKELGPTAFAAAGAALVAFGADSVQVATAAANSQLELANAVQNSGLAASSVIPAFQAQAQALQDLTGVDDNLINEGQGLMVNLGLQQDQITQLTPLAVDLAQRYGLDVTKAFSVAGKAASGSTTALAKLVGPIEKGATEAETYATVLDKLGTSAGFAAQKAQSEPWILLQAAFHDLQESVGSALLPAVQELIPALTELVEVASPILVQAFVQVADTVEPLIEAISGLADMMDGASDSGSHLSGFMSQLAGVNAVATDVFTAQTDIMGDLQQAWDGTTAATEENAAATADAVTNVVSFADAQAKAARETRNATLALQENRQAQLENAGGLLGLVTGLQAANEAQAKVQELRKAGTLDTAEGTAAIIKATQANLDFAQSWRQFQADNPAAGIAKTRDALREMAQQAGISGKEFRSALGGALDEVTGKIDGLRQKAGQPIRFQVDTSAFVNASAQASRLASQLDRLS